ncbi:trehalose-phosphatase [Natrialbaceae archaeon A-gly3]
MATLPPPIDERLPRLRHGLRNASHLLVCLDFDGTLAPIVEEPEAATITPTNAAALEALASDERVTTAVVSGRALADVRERVDPPDAYAGNHGLEIERDGSVTVHPDARQRTTLIDEVCAVLETALESIPGTRIENKRLTGTVHVRSVPEPARPFVRRAVEGATELIGEGDLEVSTGRCVLEVSPAIDWGKGEAVAVLEDRHPGEPFVVYAGDDVTDESAFRTVEPEGLGVLVGDRRESAASARLRSPAATASLLRWLAEVGVELLGTGRRERPIPA